MSSTTPHHPGYNTAAATPGTTDPHTIDWAAHQGRAVIPFEVVGGLPVNPITTGLNAGRGGLRHWGEAVCADAAVFAFDQDDYKRILLIERGDGHGWALPGGKLDPGETPRTAAARELAEETGLTVNPDSFYMLPGRGVPDPRAGANAWMVTIPAVLPIRPHTLPEVQGMDDARQAKWLPANSYAALTTAVGLLGGELFPAHTALLRELLAP